MPKTLCDHIRSAFKMYSDRIAITTEAGEKSYSLLYEKTSAITNHLHHTLKPTSRFVGLFTSRSFDAYAALFAVLLSGRAYMPLNPKSPPKRIESMVTQAECDTILLAPECVESFRLAAGRLQPLNVVCTAPECDLTAEFPQHRFSLTDWSRTEPPQEIAVGSEAPAYLLFTSGSTGTPKGVVVSHGNVCAYLEYVVPFYGFCPTDRFSQMFDLTFDLSVHDIFTALLSGGTLCVVPDRQIMSPYKFIRDNRITVWFSVPSVAMFMARMGMLKPGSFPALRFSLFCGEALPEQSAKNWQAAAPNSIIENLYGPTEATIAITRYRWNENASPGECVNGVVPIGSIFPGHAARLDAGELCLTGPQVTDGYLNNPEETARRFVAFPDSPETWYRTGDMVQKSAGGLAYLGRVDEQVQIRGYRAELQEIDRALRQAVGFDLAVAVPVSTLDDGTVDAVFGYVQSTEEGGIDSAEVIRRCRELLPEYMAPSRIILVDKLPLNSNGKIDRKGLSQWR